MGPVTVEGRHDALPKSYSPPSAPISWKDREPWPEGSPVSSSTI